LCDNNARVEIFGEIPRSRLGLRRNLIQEGLRYVEKDFHLEIMQVKQEREQR
jgi:hypothetical protein